MAKKPPPRLSNQAIILMSLVTAGLWYYKRHKWTVLKSRKIAYKPKV